MFYADLHIHSKYSRATSRDCDLEHLALWAAKKGISVVGTGDFTHPGWFAEIRDKLTPAEPGLFRLRPDLERELCRSTDGPAPSDVRFLLQVEISTIYKKDGQTRKVHHLLYAPELAHAERITQSLARIGNLASDGRPILGLDSRNLLEITLAAGEGCFLIPAHIWTPWFAVLGSKSGFDSIEHCYGDLSSEVFALETGLSSDPEMNWRLSQLDRYALVSNSDAHSPAKLGREACRFHTERDYFALRRALATGDGYGGTVEFFPEEGKYHLDGHRTCGVRLEPDETRRCEGLCPMCGKPLTLGVMYRVCELADRPTPPNPLPARAAPFRSLIPLDEILGELCGVGPQSKTVRQRYDELLVRLGPELCILDQVPAEDLRRAGSPLLAEALTRMRERRVIRQGGYDGEYGVIRLFTPDELLTRTSAGLLFDMPKEEKPKAESRKRKTTPRDAGSPEPSPIMPPASSAFGSPLSAVPVLSSLDADQRAAAEIVSGPLLVIAGPGTGKTRTLTHRLAHLVLDHGARPEQCLALTFSRRAASEMSERLAQLLPDQAARLSVLTFHRLGLAILQEQSAALGWSVPHRVAGEPERLEMLRQTFDLSERAAGQLLSRISRHKRQPAAEIADDDAAAFARYEQELCARAWLDFDDLIVRPLELFARRPDLAEQYRARYCWVSVDEYQDIDAAQYALLRQLVPAHGNLCAIGDPDQAIYGFRGADVGYFQRFGEDFPNARTVRLTRNYRSTQTIVDAALELIAPSSLVADRRLLAQSVGARQVEIHACATERAEAEFVVHSIERLLGGSTFFSLDSQRAAGHESEEVSFADIAVLYRTEAQADALAEALTRSGMPFERRCHERLGERPWVQSVLRAIEDADESSGSVSERLERAIKRAFFDAPPADAALPALRDLAARCASDLPGFLSELALGTDVDLWDPRADRIALLTLHAAKGLEFLVVFLVGCEDGLLPLHWGAPDAAVLAEERRLFFVGMTRAERRLILTHARKRFWRGAVRELPLSPFLADVRSELLALERHESPAKSKPVDHQRTLFD